MSIIIMRSTFDFLRLCQVWPDQKEELNPSKWFFIKFTLVLVTTLVNLTGGILHLCFVAIPNRSFSHVAEDLVTVVAQMGAYYYLIFFTLFHKIASRFYVKLSSFETFGKPPDFDQHSKKLYYLSLGNRLSLAIFMIVYFTEPLLTKHSCEKRNRDNHLEDICGLVNAAWMPFNIRNFPKKQFFYLWQMYSVFWVYQPCAAITELIMASIEHVLVRVWHLKLLIKTAIETEDDELRKQQLSKCLKYHVFIFELADHANRAYKGCLFVHIVFTGVLFGIMCFSVLHVQMSIRTISLFMAWTSSVISASISAQRLHDESVSVSDEVYNSEWYDRNWRFQKNLVLVIQRSQRPISIQAGPVAELSVIFILNIFKTAYSYLTVLSATSQ